MFELSVACKYLIPRRRQLSVSIISLISVLVIALVVWLIVVFFSVTNGLEKTWVQKLIALTAPVRITPTDAYYQSYYYQVDSHSQAADFSSKTIHEKQHAFITDPYDPELDQELPAYIPLPDSSPDGTVKDLVKLVYQSIDKVLDVPGLKAKDFELTATYIHLNLSRPTTLTHTQNLYGGSAQSTLNYPAYLGNFEGDNPPFERTLLPIENQDLNNILSLLGRSRHDLSNSHQNDALAVSKKHLHNSLNYFFDVVHVQELKTRSMGWTIPARLIPKHVEWGVAAIVKNQKVIRLVIPSQVNQLQKLLLELEEEGVIASPATLSIRDKKMSIALPNELEQLISSKIPLSLAPQSSFSASLDASSLEKTDQVDHVHFQVSIPVQGTVLKGQIPLRGLDIAKATILPIQSSTFPFWVYSLDGKHEDHDRSLILPHDQENGEGVILPKSFRDAGVLIGDRGSLSYMAPLASMIEEQQIPIYVAGFYDPGIIPIGGKFILANAEVTSLIRDSHQQDDHGTLTNGINVRFNNFEDAQKVKEQLQKSFKESGIQRYWKIETYQEYEFTKEIIHELQSQKTLFSLIAIVIIIVACSNIISMLIILVNDKKMEIGILRSMGATSKNIALIFGFAGALIGVAGSVIGICSAILTLTYLNHLIRLLSHLQGHDMFSANLYGHMLPTDLSMEALSFVLVTTVFLSLLAGLVPAIKACLLRPSQILRTGAG